MIKGLGPVSARNLIAWSGDPAAVFHAPPGKLARIPGIGRKTISLIRSSDTLGAAEKELRYCEREKIRVLHYLETEYPDRLRYIHDAPLILFQKGNARLNEQEGIAIVGTRTPSLYGKEMAARFAAFFAEKGINIVSGLAYGIDMAAHRAVLDVNGITTAVLGHGLDRIYPYRHKTKAGEILDRGAWISEFISGTPPDAVNFPARNRIISGLSRAVIVVEAASKGGALITARFAFGQNREVYAVPGRLDHETSDGCNRLIRDDIARLVTHPQEVLDDLEIQWEAGKTQYEKAAPQIPEVPLTAPETRIIRILSEGEALIDRIIQQSGLPVREVNALLISLEFKGLVQQLPGKKFRLK
jgi:DNA processing protein